MLTPTQLSPRSKLLVHAALVCALVTLAPRLTAQNPPGQKSVSQSASVQPAPSQTATPESNPLSRPPRAWVEDAARLEAADIDYKGFYLRYRMHQVNSKGDMTRDVIESQDGAVARLILRDGHPLTPEEDKAEQERLQAMLNSPAAFARHIKEDHSGKKIALDLVKLMPDAMSYTYVTGQPQRADLPANALPEVVLDFEPNPAWTPPNLTSEALTGLKGRIWVETKTHHMTRMEGAIFRPVNFGWGMLARINPGGKLSLEQVPVARAHSDSGERWIFSDFTEDISLRALMLKTMQEKAQAQASHFTVVPPMPYQQAIHQLLDTPLPH